MAFAPQPNPWPTAAERRCAAGLRRKCGAVLPDRPAIPVQEFTATGSLNTARELHTSTLLSNGRVLIAGGSGSGTGASAELYESRVPGPSPLQAA